MALVLRMNPGWKQKVVIEHAGERMEIRIEVDSGNYKRTALILDASPDWKFTREKM